MSIRKIIFVKMISICLNFGVNIIGLPADPIEIGKFARYKYINAKR